MLNQIPKYSLTFWKKNKIHTKLKTFIQSVLEISALEKKKKGNGSGK